MALTTVRRRDIGVQGSAKRELVIQHNKNVNRTIIIPVENLGAGADITARIAYALPVEHEVDAVSILPIAASSGVDSGNTLVVQLVNITDTSAVIAAVTRTADLAANTPVSLTLVAAEAACAANDVIGIVVTQGAASDAGLFAIQVRYRECATISNDSGTAWSA
jgi:hypothetical protein